MAVGAGHPRGGHPTLEKGAVCVDLIELLTVGMIDARGEKRGKVVVLEGRTCHIPLGDLHPLAVALCADRHLALIRCRSAPLSRPCPRMDHPPHLVSL
jgi:hypothetical protein